ncbi:aliphatic sulfonate ABC transporter substrate-binding protein [Lederbergia citrea]|uniref:Putative aliphatic sulfonates-binding protein n=1 Tax=Lederbergia citrea TaxID=2833581 RepID=A0A942UXG6_9BACI|nr:aliphatic sulfonate ABC transporter substrate-binding protein [Lederbergia citrea]MBS4205962.1 aliphatic sulfonate ABC transporter substrate-binding protein [Lederbergia citrea]MBS4224589.1 aliphatic sulfonate ABC transporter substrate-binding protein [Lederbergia citrea]
MKTWIIKTLLLVIAVVALAGCSSNASGEEGKPKKITLDYAHYSPTSLVLKEKGFAEELFKKEGIEIEFVLSQGSNKALEFLNSKSVDFGSAAGGAALMAKAKGSPIETVYIFSKPEWTALVSTDSAIKTVNDLKGKKVAATLGTDPYIFLLRALEENGLSGKDVEIINLQHGDGAAALLSGEVDAWAGLDPHMAKVENNSGANLFFRNADFNTYGTLNVRSEFAEKYPEYVTKVIEVYEKARQWAIDNPEETAEILAKEAQIDLNVAKIQLERNDFSTSKPGDEQRTAIKAAGDVLKSEGILETKTDIEKVVNELINPDFFK